MLLDALVDYIVYDPLESKATSSRSRTGSGAGNCTSISFSAAMKEFSATLEGMPIGSSRATCKRREGRGGVVGDELLVMVLTSLLQGKNETLAKTCNEVSNRNSPLYHFM